MAFCERLSEQLAVVAVIPPAAYAGATNSNIVTMTFHRRALFIMSTGANPTGILVNIQENAALGFTAGTATVITRPATACTAVDSQYLFEVTAEAMGLNMQYLRAQVTPSGAGHYISLVALADVVRYHPASDYDLATVVSIQVHV